MKHITCVIRHSVISFFFFIMSMFTLYILGSFFVVHTEFYDTPCRRHGWITVVSLSFLAIVHLVGKTWQKRHFRRRNYSQWWSLVSVTGLTTQTGVWEGGNRRQKKGTGCMYIALRRFLHIKAISRQKPEARTMHRQQCTLHAFEQFGTLYMHNQDNLVPPGYKPQSIWMSRRVEEQTRSGEKMLVNVGPIS